MSEPVSKAPEPANGDPPKKRRWFQIHLSTAIVLMVVASAMIGIFIMDNEKFRAIALSHGYDVSVWEWYSNRIIDLWHLPIFFVFILWGLARLLEGRIRRRLKDKDGPDS